MSSYKIQTPEQDTQDILEQVFVDHGNVHLR